MQHADSQQVDQVVESVLAQLNSTASEPQDAGAGGRAYTVLRAGITRNLLPPGTRLSEAEIAGALNVSRTPVRSAFQRLLQEGLVEVGPKRQLFVREFGLEDRRETMLLRAALERITVGQAAGSIDLDQIDDLRLILMRQRRAADRGDIETFIELDDQFHLGIARSVGLRQVEEFLRQLRGLIRLMGIRVLLEKQDRRYQVLDEHEAILTALETHDEAAALAALDEHLSNTYDLPRLP